MDPLPGECSSVRVAYANNKIAIFSCEEVCKVAFSSGDMTVSSLEGKFHLKVAAV